MLHLYAITDVPEPPPVPGLEGAPLRALRHGGLTLICSEREEGASAAEEAEVWAHETVVEAAMERGSVLPMRLGSAVREERDAIELLRGREGEFARALTHVRGAVELALRVWVEEDGASKDAEELEPVAAGAAGEGTKYMRSRLNRKLLGDAVEARIEAALAPLSRDSIRAADPGGQTALKASYLVDRELVEAFAERVERLQREVAGLTAICTGPWPPYSFTTERS